MPEAATTGREGEPPRYAVARPGQSAPNVFTRYVRMKRGLMPADLCHLVLEANLTTGEPSAVFDLPKYEGAVMFTLKAGGVPGVRLIEKPVVACEANSPVWIGRMRKHAVTATCVKPVYYDPQSKKQVAPIKTPMHINKNAWLTGFASARSYIYLEVDD